MTNNQFWIAAFITGSMMAGAMVAATALIAAQSSGIYCGGRA